MSNLPLDRLIFDYDDEPFKDLALSNAPFRPENASGEIAGLRIHSKNGEEIKLGNADSITIGVSAETALEGQLALYWETDALDEDAKRLLPSNIDFHEHGIIALAMEAEAGIEANAAAPIGAYLSGAFGGSSKGELQYYNYMVFRRGEPARATMAALYEGLRLPSSLPAEDFDWAPGQAIGYKLKGGLKLWGSLVAGYETQGSKDVSLKGITAEFRYRIIAGAKLALKLNLGGEFEIVQSHGSEPGWTRLRAYRSSQQNRGLSLALDIGADLELTGLPENPIHLLKAVTGFDLENSFAWLNEVNGIDDWPAAKAQLSDKFGKIVGESASDLIEKLAGSAQVQAIQEKIGSVLESYAQFKDEIDARTLEIAAEAIGDAKPTIQRIDKLLAVTERKGLSKISDSEVWKLVDRLAGDAVHDFLIDQHAFVEVRSKLLRLRKLLNGEAELKPLRDFIEAQEQRFNIDRITEDLAKMTDPAKLKSYLNKESNKLARKLFNVTTGKLSNSKLSKTFAQVQKSAEELLEWRKKIAEALQDGLKQKLQLSLAVAFSTSKSSEAWIDMEFDHRSSKGRKALAQAVKGDFADSLAAFSKEHVLVRKAAFQREIEKSKSLKLHAFGWSQERIAKIKSLTNTEIVQQGGGLVYLHDTELSQELSSKSGFGNAETLSTLYQLRVQSNTLAFDADSASAQNRHQRRQLLSELASISTQYKVERADAEPHWSELPGYLNFAEQLGIASASELANALQADFGPEDPESLEIKYEIRDDGRSLADVFADDERNDTDDWKRLRERTSKAFRAYFVDRQQADPKSIFTEETLQKYLKYRYLRRKRVGPRHRRPPKYRFEFVDENGNTHKGLLSGRVLKEAYDAERRFLKALRRLDEIFDKLREEGEEEDVYLDDLERAAFELMRVPAKTSFRVWKENIFFLVLDALQREVDPESRVGLVSMQIDLKPHGKPAIRRIFTA